jgi:hypothetical protein
MQATGSTPQGGLGSLQDMGSTTKPRHHRAAAAAKPASNGDTHAATDVEAQQLQALATLKDLQVQGLNLGLSRRGAGRGVQEAGIHEDEDMPPRPDSAASNHSWSSLAESDPPSPTELQGPMSVNRPQQQQQQQPLSQQKAAPAHAMQPVDAPQQQQPQPQQVPQGRSMGMMVDVRGPETRPTGEHGAQMPLRSLAMPPASHGSQQPPQTQRGPPSGRFTPSSDSRYSAPQPQSNGNGTMMSQQQQQQQQQQQPRLAPPPPPPPPPPPQHTGPPVEHWHEDEDPWSSKPRMDSVAYQQWLQAQARRAAGSAPPGATPWQKAAHAMLPSQRLPPAGRGGWTPPSNAGRYSQQQSQYDSLRPGPPGMQQGQQQMQRQQLQQQGLPRGYYADDYDPQSGAVQRTWSGGSGGSGQVRGILRASSYNQVPSAHPSWGSNASDQQQGWGHGQGMDGMQQQRSMSMVNGRGPPMGQQGMYPGGPGSQPGMYPMQRGGHGASPVRGNSFGPPGPNSWGPPSQRQQQQQQWLSRDDVGGPYQQEAQYPNRRPPGQQGRPTDRAMSMPAYSM